MNSGTDLVQMPLERQWFLMSGKVKYLCLLYSMKSNESPEFKFMYRRDGKGDKYLDITKVLDSILDRLDDIEEKLNKMDQNG